MSLAKKHSRKITIDGINYLWQSKPVESFYDLLTSEVSIAYHKAEEKRVRIYRIELYHGYAVTPFMVSRIIKASIAGNVLAVISQIERESEPVDEGLVRVIDTNEINE